MTMCSLFYTFSLLETHLAKGNNFKLKQLKCGQDVTFKVLLNAFG